MEDNKIVIKTIEEIQKECKHKSGYEVKFLGDTGDVRRFCKTCGAIVGYPSEQEYIDNGFKNIPLSGA